MASRENPVTSQLRSRGEKSLERPASLLLGVIPTHLQAHGTSDNSLPITVFSRQEKQRARPGRGVQLVQPPGCGCRGLTCREIDLGVDGRGGGQEGRMSHEEGAEGALGQQRRALLGGDVLTAAHAAVDLEVQGLAFLLGSEKETEREEENVSLRTHKDSRGPYLLGIALRTHSPSPLALPPSRLSLSRLPALYSVLSSPPALGLYCSHRLEDPLLLCQFTPHMSFITLALVSSPPGSLP